MSGAFVLYLREMQFKYGRNAGIGRVPLRFPRWPVVEAQLGRRGEERLGAGGDRSVRDRLSRGPRGERGREGRQGELDEFPARDEAARLERDELFVSDKCLGLVENLEDFYPEAKWQRCVVHFYRNVWAAVPTGKVKEVAAMLKTVHAQEDRQAAKEKARQIVDKLRAMKLAKAAELVENGIDETLSYYELQPEHRRCLRSNNPLERLMREIRRRTRVVGAFPDGKSALMLVAARLRHVAGTRWGTKRYLQMNRLAEVVAIA